jgi:hypothetical protein
MKLEKLRLDLGFFFQIISSVDEKCSLNNVTFSSLYMSCEMNNNNKLEKRKRKGPKS